MRKAIVLLMLLTFTCTSQLGQKYVISLVHGSSESSKGVHEHQYDNWAQLERARNPVDANGNPCMCECHNCFISPDDNGKQCYSFKNLIELPVTHLLGVFDTVPLVRFDQIKSNIPANINWPFKLLERLERPPSSGLYLC